MPNRHTAIIVFAQKRWTIRYRLTDHVVDKGCDYCQVPSPQTIFENIKILGIRSEVMTLHEDSSEWGSVSAYFMQGMGSFMCSSHCLVTECMNKHLAHEQRLIREMNQSAQAA